MGKDFCPNFIQPFLENVDRGSCYDENRELIPEKADSPSAVDLTLECLVGPRRVEGRKNQVWIHIQ